MFENLATEGRRAGDVPAGRQAVSAERHDFLDRRAAAVLFHVVIDGHAVALRVGPDMADVYAVRNDDIAVGGDGEARRGGEGEGDQAFHAAGSSLGWTSPLGSSQGAKRVANLRRRAVLPTMVWTRLPCAASQTACATGVPR